MMITITIKEIIGIAIIVICALVFVLMYGYASIKDWLKKRKNK